MQAPGLIPIMPSGAMYMMVKIDFSRLENFSDDMHFCQALVSEKSVFVLPGSCFGFPNFFRVVITITKANFISKYIIITHLGSNSRSMSKNRRLLQRQCKNRAQNKFEKNFRAPCWRICDSLNKNCLTK